MFVHKDDRMEVAQGCFNGKEGEAVYVTKCSPVEVVPRTHTNCTEEIPVVINGTEAFVDPISYVIKSAGGPHTLQRRSSPQVQGGWQVVLQLPAAEGMP